MRGILYGTAIVGIATILSLSVFAPVSESELHHTMLRISTSAVRVFADEVLEDATLQQLWLLAHYGRDAFIAGEEYPEEAVALYEIFGETDKFSEILRVHGYKKVVPVVWRFLESSSFTVSWGRKAGYIFQALKGLQLPSREELKKEPSAVERAWIAIEKIRIDGNEFLRQFAKNKDGKTERVVAVQIIAITEDVFIGSTVKLAAKYQLEEKITRGDVFGAGLELVSLGLGSKTIGLVRKGSVVAGHLGKQAKARAFLLRTGGALVPFMMRHGKVTVLAMTTGFAYLFFRSPVAFTQFLSALSVDVLGLSPYVGSGNMLDFYEHVHHLGAS